MEDCWSRNRTRRLFQAASHGCSLANRQREFVKVISLKRPREIELMREAGRLVARAHRLIRNMIEPGVTTEQIDSVVETLFAQHGATPLFKGVPGKVPFPSVCCISINEQVVHGIPGVRRLEPGDIVKVDTG